MPDGGPYAFDPDWTVAPGETLKETLAELGLGPISAVVTLLGLPLVEVQGILDGTMTITMFAAARLEHLTGVTAALWLQLDANYWDDLARGKKRVQ